MSKLIVSKYYPEIPIPIQAQCLFAGFSFFWKKNFSKSLGKSLFPEKRKIKSCGKKISLVFANWLILGIGHKLLNLHKLTYWFDVLTNGNAGFYIAPPLFPRIGGFSKIWKNYSFFRKKEKPGETFLLVLFFLEKLKSAK